MSKIRVGVLRGGPSAEHEISLLTGANVLENLSKDKYQGFDILISKEGKWSDFPKVDVIVADDGVYILEANTLPGLTKESLVPKAAAAVGCSFDQLLDHLLTLALRRKGA